MKQQRSPVAPKIPWKSTIFVLKYVEHAFGDISIECVKIYLSSVSVICPSHSGCLMGIPILQDWILMIPHPLVVLVYPVVHRTFFCFASPGNPACSSSAALLRFTSKPNRMELKMIIPATNNPKARLFNLDPGSPAGPSEVRTFQMEKPSLIFPSALTKTTKKKSKK